MATWLLALAAYTAWWQICLRAMAGPDCERLVGEILLTMGGIGLALTVALVLCTRFVWRALSARRRRAAAVAGGGLTKA